MQKEYVIYKVTNLINQKMYIGKTYNFEKRKREHLYDIDNGLPFHKALKKYGVKNFKWEIIDSASTDEEIKEMEKLCDEVDHLILNKEPHMDKDIEFHGAIARSSKNIVIANLIPIINKSISLCIDVTDKKLAKETMDTHREILNCIKAKDINGAHDAMYLHLMYNRRNIKNLIEMRNKNI